MTRFVHKTLFLAFLIGGCGADSVADERDPGNPTDPSNPDHPDPDDPDPDVPDPTQPDQVTVQLAPRPGVTGTQRVNFAVPLASGKVADPANVRVLAGGTEIASGRRVLATYPDGTARSIQLQVEVDVSSTGELVVELGAPATQSLSLVAVSTLLEPADGTQGPRVWARLPAAFLAASGVVGPALTVGESTGPQKTAWDGVCDYADHDVDAFLALQGSRDVWLYDRGTAMYRGHARRGDQVTLESAYRETAIYRARITGTGTATRIGVPTAESDLKYHYTQNLAIHYLLTGDDRFRESAEDVATRVRSLWGTGAYDGRFWTERHAGFGLLAYLWASIVSDDRAAEFAANADTAVANYVAMQMAYPAPDTMARCFAHSADSAGEGFGTLGCSPWMSAILADGLDQYASERSGAAADAARGAIVRLGNAIAQDGLDGEGRPFYWQAIGGGSEVDDYDEHWGESAYVTAMAWHWGGRTDAALRATVNELMAGLADHGTAPHLRSFNWQCRSAPGTAWYLR
jgi:hypothetical protein